MKRRVWLLALTLAVVGAGWSAGLAQTEVEPPKTPAQEAYDKVAEAYLNSQWAELKQAQIEAASHARGFTPPQRIDIAYIRKTAPEFCPPWWKLCKSTTPTQIRPTIWGREVTVSFVPASKPDTSTQLDSGKRTITVNWNPSLIDSLKPVEGTLGLRHKLTTGDMGEVVVWQQLGLSYISAFLPTNTLVTLYKENRHLYEHLQAFYGNLTGLYHCSPKARRLGMLLHGDILAGNRESSEGGVRACRAISAMFTSMVLADPKKWPSINLPFSVPPENIEAKTGAYLYSNVEPTWTVAEDKAFRDAVRDMFRNNGDRALRNRGAILLPNRMGFMLMEPDDRQLKVKREAWIKARLEKAIQ